MEYVDKISEESRASGNSSGFFRVVKNFSSKDKPKPWAVTMIYPDIGEQEVANKVTDFFGAVSDLLPALNWDNKPTQCGGPGMDILTDGQVAELIKKAKKPNSMVGGDIFPLLYGKFDLSKMVTPIFNMIILTRS